MIQIFWNLITSLKNVRFEEPVKLQLLAAVLALFVINVFSWLLWLYRRPQKTFGSKYRLFGVYKLWFLLTAVLAILICAWAMPYVTQGNLVVKRGKVDVVFIVDSSASSLLQDTGLARIEIASREISKLTAHKILREGDSAALFLLGLGGIRLLPMTSDLDSFSSEVSKIGIPSDLYSSGVYWDSNLGSTLKKVYTSLDRQDMFAEFKRKEPKNWVPKVRDNRIVVLLSDGDFFNYGDKRKEDIPNKSPSKFEEEDRKFVARQIKEFKNRGLKIYPIGIGTRTGAPIISILENYKRIDEYDPVLEKDLEGQYSRLNASNLDYLRSATGAERLFLMESSNADASDFLRTVIDSHRSTTIESGMSLDREELWMHFVVAALGLLLLAGIITRF